ncbi:MAG: hypothetical protein A2W99_15525 [Bacteroidetes bacterium GWF2_33_16]|nr:MAG: hypothetical protein A2X00_09735 [Bacteroidetes bacterium GWE2_32_14]OFY07729.1 MAG: hypothetical protein A2W99_15525 [Bacteroidetes bacterium GWF2_33_16]
MENLKKYKIYAVCTLIVHIVLCFALFSNIRNLIEKNAGISTYLLIIFLLIIGVIFFVLTILLTNKKESEDYIHKTVVESKTDIEEDEIQETSNKSIDDIDVEHYIKKLLPKDDSKLNSTKYTEKVLSNFAKELDIVQGLFYLREKESDQFSIAGKYAYFGETDPQGFKVGQTLSGQVALNKTILYLEDIPENFVTILSGLGSSSPKHLLIIPVIVNNETIAIIELASFKEFKKSWRKLFEELAHRLGEPLSKYIS